MDQLKLIVLVCLVAICATGCKKYLDKKPDQQLAIPATIKDYQALLDNNNLMNQVLSGSIGEASADNYYLSNSDWASLNSEGEKNMYVWGDEIIYSAFPNAWLSLYRTVYYANLVLENIDELIPEPNELDAYNNVIGSARFLRAKSFLQTAVLWAKTYDSSTADTDMGIPLKLSTDFNVPVTRASVKQTYAQILEDLKVAAQRLPNTATHVMRPSKAAAFALLARTYLAMGDFTRAYYYADSSLQVANDLINYNGLNASSNFPVVAFNVEVLFHTSAGLGLLSNARAKIDSQLYRSYATNDLRKTIFFKPNPDGSFAFKGSYTGSNTQFLGITTSEVYLTKAEALSRLGRQSEALDVLNALLVKRWKTGTYTALTLLNTSEPLKTILTERRKELVMRDLRWMDLKRLNKETAHQQIIKRVLNNQEIVLPPNDPRYALPIPQTEIELTGMQQNPR